MVGLGPAREAARRLRALGAPVRAHDWWEFKLAPALGLVYGGLLAAGAPLLPHVAEALLLLVALAAAAAFVSVLNDLTDLGVDAAAGKPNRMAGRSPRARALMLAATLLVGGAFAWTWRGDRPLAGAYLASFAVFLLYSLPPARLKGRGALGAAADAAGAHLFPALTAFLLASRTIAAPADPLLLAAASLWGFAYGLRGILWHQLGDAKADARAEVRTLVRAWGPAAARRFGRWVALPLELAGLALLLWRTHALVAALFLAVHLLAVLRKQAAWRRLVEPEAGRSIALHSYYALWLPAGIIVQSALRHPADILLLGLHVLLFPVRVRQALRPRTGG